MTAWKVGISHKSTKKQVTKIYRLFIISYHSKFTAIKSLLKIVGIGAHCGSGAMVMKDANILDRITQ